MTTNTDTGPEYAVVNSGRIACLLGRLAPLDSQRAQDWLRIHPEGGELAWWRLNHHGRGDVVELAETMAVGDPVHVVDGVALHADGSQHEPVKHTISFRRCEEDEHGNHDPIHEWPGCDRVDWQCTCKWQDSAGRHAYPSDALEQATKHLVAHDAPLTLPAVPPMSESAISEWRGAVETTEPLDDVGG